jgi:hypothetical protein
VIFTIKQATAKVGISEGLLVLWIDSGKFKPSSEISMKSSYFPMGSLAQRAIAAHAGGPDVEVLGWNRFHLTDEDIERLGAMVEQTAERKSKAPAHVKGSHYTVQELATEWGVSEDTIRKMFEDEPGILRHGKSVNRRGKRRYLSIRIPEEVAQRVHQRLSQV